MLSWKFFLVAQVFLSLVTMSMSERQRILIVSHPDHASTQKIRLKDDEKCETVQDVYQLIRDRNLATTSDFHLEFLSKESGRFISYDRDDKSFNFNFLRGFLTVLLVPIKTPASGETSTQLCIKGREFDVLHQALKIGPNQREIKIQERSEAEKGTGLITWDGAVVLAKYLEKNVQDVVVGKRILEVGSGTGVAGIAAAFLSPKHVLLSDLPYALHQLNLNVAASCHMEEEKTLVEVAELDWSRKETYPTATQFDVVIGADVVWLEELVVPLVTALSHLCTPEHTVLILSHQTRTLRADKLLFDELKLRGFDMSREPESQLHADYTTPRIGVYRGVKRREHPL